MKMRLCVDHSGGSVTHESTAPEVLQDAIWVLQRATSGPDEVVVSVPSDTGYVMVRADQIDRIDLTWEA